MNIHISRPSEFRTVTTWLNSEAKSGQVDIFGISGYGGIGKTYLLSQVLDNIKPVSKGYLQIKIDGSDPSILGDFMALYDRKFAPRTVPHGKSDYDYFPHARDLVRQHKVLTKSVNEAVKKSASPDDVKKAASWIFRGGSVLNKSIPKTREYLDFDSLQKLGVDKRVEEAIDLLAALKEIEKTSWLPGRVKDVFGITYRESLKTDLFRLSADELLADLCAILNRYQRYDRLRLTHSPIKGLDRLLLIIDDFEILGKTIINFVTTALVPVLEQANFHSTIIILGRDTLSDAHISFQHHLSHLVRETIRLEQFPDHIAHQMFLESGYSETDIPKLMEESQGYPFLVRLLCEARGGSVSFYQQFYERTTRWMTPTEKSWVLPLCYLDRITEASIKEMLPNAPALSVMTWFKHEASLRDPNAEWYSIAPYIRRTLKEYHHKEIGTKSHEEFTMKGKQASNVA
ncbi:MAG: hypothetical protein RQ754_05995 [Desulfuromonadales bacterium]|nr:hypothetical protein [Desulfuromonadales bacterium]